MHSVEGTWALCEWFPKIGDTVNGGHRSYRVLKEIQYVLLFSIEEDRPFTHCGYSIPAWMLADVHADVDVHIRTCADLHLRYNE